MIISNPFSLRANIILIMMRIKVFKNSQLMLVNRIIMFKLMSIFMMINLKIPILRLLSKIVNSKILLIVMVRSKLKNLIENMIWKIKSKINKF